jgi:hypothetical protein
MAISARSKRGLPALTLELGLVESCIILIRVRRGSQTSSADEQEEEMGKQSDRFKTLNWPRF